MHFCVLLARHGPWHGKRRLMVELVGVVASIRIANGHGGETKAHALIQHTNVVVEGVKGGGFYFELFVSAGNCQS